MFNPANSDTNVQAVISAWHGVTDRWFTRQHWKYDDGKPWEVVHDWGVDVIADETMRVVDRFATQKEADQLAEKLDNEARARAVLALFQ